MKKSRIKDKDIPVFIWRIDLSMLIFPAVVIILLVGAFSRLAAVILSGASALAYILTMIFYIPLYNKNMKYTADERAIVIHKGVFYKRNAVIPVSSIQYCILLQGYIQKYFGRCTVAVMLAGSLTFIRQIPLSEGKRLVTLAQKNEQVGGESDG